MPNAIHLPKDPASLDLRGDPRDLPGAIYEAILDLYVMHVDQSGNPRAAVLATARMVTENARLRRWPRAQADQLGDIAAKLCQDVCDETIGAVD